MGNPTQDAELSVAVKRIENKLDDLITKLDKLMAMVKEGTK